MPVIKEHVHEVSDPSVTVIPVGETEGGLAAHAAAGNPHPTYETAAEAQAKVDAAVAALVNAAPSTLNTLKELSDALAADPDFATTITTALAGKQATLTPASQVEMEAGTEPAIRSMSPLRVAQAIAALAATAREWIQGSDGALASGTNLPWAHFAGDALLDYTNPLVPTVIEAGLYTVMAAVRGPSDIVDETKKMFVGLDAIGGDVFQDGIVGLVPAYVGGVPLVSHSLTLYFEADDTIELIVRHNLAAPDDFAFDAWVQRI